MSKFESSPVVKAFRENLREVKNWRSAHFVCGVSGGIDSMTLLFIMHRFDIKCTVVHCNYQLRGDASENDRNLVEQVSAMWNYDCITATFNPEEAENQNTQAWARDKRYRVFRDIKKEIDADYILTAHHQTDQVETILQKIFRGSGLSSWTGINLIEGDLFRPLINVTKQQVLEFAESHQVPYREDQTNKTPGYARNFLRHELTPDMNKFFPGWRENILKLPNRAEEFSIMTDYLLSEVLTSDNQFNRSSLLELPEKLWPVLLLRYLKRNLPDTTISEGALSRFHTINELQTGSEIVLNTDWKIVRDRDRLNLVSCNIEEHNRNQYKLTKEDLTHEQLIAGCKFSMKEWDGVFEEGYLQFDADKIKWPIMVRHWEKGDRIQCLGMQGTKTIADLLTDKKISSLQKKESFLIESFDGIISAVIFPHITADGQPGIISEQVKCSSVSKQVLQIFKISHGQILTRKS